MLPAASTVWAAVRVSFGSFSKTSGNRPTTNGRRAEAPSAFQTLSQQTPGTAFGEDRNLQLLAVFGASAVTSSRSVHTFTGSAPQLPRDFNFDRLPNLPARRIKPRNLRLRRVKICEENQPCKQGQR